MDAFGGFSSLKDTDREILLRLSDKDLIKTCRLNKYLSSLKAAYIQPYWIFK